MRSGIGEGGHTGIVLGVNSQGKDTKVAVLSYSRFFVAETVTISAGFSAASVIALNKASK